MTKEQLNKGKELCDLIFEKKRELFDLQNSKIISLTSRIFRPEKSEYVDVYYRDFPTQKIKGLMVEHIKNQILILETAFQKLGTPEEKEGRLYITESPTID